VDVRYDNIWLLHAEVPLDFVSAIRCLEWPAAVAEAWLGRNSRSGWPPRKIKERLIGEGCLLVLKAHGTSEWPALEMRISFTRAERILASLMSDLQRQCCVLMKLLVKRSLQPENVITSYHLKTVLFWACERFPASLWEEDDASLAKCFLALLDALYDYLNDGYLPHYFFQDNNLFASIPVSTLQSIAGQVRWIREHVLDSVFNFDQEYRFRFAPPKLHLFPILEPVIEMARNASNDDFKQSYTCFHKALIEVAVAYCNGHGVHGVVQYAREAAQVSTSVLGRNQDFVRLAIDVGFENYNTLLAVYEAVIRYCPNHRDVDWNRHTLTWLYKFTLSLVVGDHQRAQHLARREKLFQEISAANNTYVQSMKAFAYVVTRVVLGQKWFASY
jgi:hypothetical protein